MIDRIESFGLLCEFQENNSWGYILAADLKSFIPPNTDDQDFQTIFNSKAGVSYIPDGFLALIFMNNSFCLKLAKLAVISQTELPRVNLL